MKKNYLYILITFNFAGLLAQSNNELIQYYNQLKQAGYSQEQIESLAKENGINLSKQVQNANLTKPKSSIDGQAKQENTTTKFTASGASHQNGSTLDFVFGSNYFKNLTYDFSPQINIATPDNYQLGPGDELTIDLWGASETSYQTSISREGRIHIEGVGPIYLNGYTISSARQRIIKSLASIYKGLMSDLPNEKINIEVSLLKSRSVFVSIIGQVNNPGLYTLNGLSTVIHGLYSAGGISQNGSFRAVELIRSGKVIAEIDLYSFFVEGKLPVLFLQDQDIIKVPYYSSRVSLEGEVKTAGIFEVKEKERLSDLFRFSGGLSAKAVDSSFLVRRIDNSRYYSLNTSSKDFELFNGDQIQVYSINDQLEQEVTIEGEVIVPGKYSLQVVKTVNDLLSSANGLTALAFRENAALFRQNSTGEYTVLPIAFDAESDKALTDLKLQQRDSLVVYKNQSFYQKDKIYIEGSVNQPGEKEYYPGMKLQDLLHSAKGLSKAEENLIVTIKTKNELLNDYIQAHESELVDQNWEEINLSPADVVYINPKSTITPLRISIEGEVKKPGIYVQSKSKASISSIINSAGGFTPYAETSAIYVVRENSVVNVQEIISDSLFNESSEASSQKIYIPITDLDDLFYFKDNDRLIVENKQNTVQITGNVLKPSVESFIGKNAKYYLKKAGISSNGSKKYTVVIYPNKEVYAVKRSLFFTSYPRVIAGSQIFVGEKPERQKLTSQELISVTSGLSTLVIVLSTLLSSN